MSTIHPELVDRVSTELSLDREIVQGTVELIEEGSTAPFIAYYRKEKCGGLPIGAIQEIERRYRELAAFRSRKRTILKNLRKIDKLTPELEARIEECDDKAALEDIYLPYKARRESIAHAALVKGLRPFAEEVLVFDPPVDLAAIFQRAAELLPDVDSVEDARTGVRDILAQLFAEDAEVRGQVRELARSKGALVSSVVPGKEEEPSRFKNFYNFSEPASSIPSHRLLAIRRGEKEGYLAMGFDFDREKMIEIMNKRILLGGSDEQTTFLNEVIEFSADNLVKPAIANEVRAETKRRADVESISVFKDNLRDMLLAPPVGPVTVIGVDPGNRTSSRLAVVDGKGEFLDSAVLFLGEGDETKAKESEDALKELVEKHQPRFVAVGNGSTSRETEKALRAVLNQLGEGKPGLVMINEAGVSVYASSDEAKEELPNHDVATRAAISMGRRIQDPLAELVKIDPRSIGVGQYQHDVNQKLLRMQLSDTIHACVNMVGVNVNTASPQLLSFVSGFNTALGKSIVEHRKQNGPFLSRAILTEVKGIGAKTFEQCAGFLRVPDSDLPLDNTAVHPESYHIVEKMAGDLSKTLEELMQDPAILDTVEAQSYTDDKAGVSTVEDILGQLRSPGTDPRPPFKQVAFREDIADVKDLEVGMILEGRVSNVTRFGAFVDVGVHHDGLVHISELSDRFVSDPSEVVRVGQVVEVRVIGVDSGDKRTRLSLSMKLEPPKPKAKPKPKPKRRKPPKEKMHTLEDLLNRFGDPRKPRIDDNNKK